MNGTLAFRITRLDNFFNPNLVSKEAMASRAFVDFVLPDGSLHRAAWIGNDLNSYLPVLYPRFNDPQYSLVHPVFPDTRSAASSSKSMGSSQTYGLLPHFLQALHRGGSPSNFTFT
jgi:hypothetical protein